MTKGERRMCVVCTYIRTHPVPHTYFYVYFWLIFIQPCLMCLDRCLSREMILWMVLARVYEISAIVTTPGRMRSVVTARKCVGLVLGYGRFLHSHHTHPHRDTNTQTNIKTMTRFQWIFWIGKYEPSINISIQYFIYFLYNIYEMGFYRYSHELKQLKLVEWA